MSQEQLKDLEGRLRAVILGTCNTIGCKNCDLKWPGGCSAADLENKILDIEFQEEKDHEKR
ncbi:hypothetical protein BdPhPhi1402_gp05 [Bdellovibrio phage phi1402]|uniref:hypothetical protein n=1 Tax=Bdellovibrio phage phi1402 TaxID=1035662 RepID=UPI000211A2C3|nr:hypothetical protein BdPhPhi1402_gp05 [Bdellovibrio phage phi1402]AEG42302.1 hypothetical protein [Bdellovibrio phage phi1402]